VRPAAPQQLAHLLNAGAINLVEVEQLSNLGKLEASLWPRRIQLSRARSPTLYSRVRPGGAA